jgi:outer membrane immunogenic protein
MGAGMTKILLVGVGIVGVALIAIVPGNAADVSVPPVYTVPVRLFSWTGCYVGGNISWGGDAGHFSSGPRRTTGVPALAGVSLGPLPATLEEFSRRSVGCNYQFTSNWVELSSKGDGEAAKARATW